MWMLQAISYLIPIALVWCGYFLLRCIGLHPVVDFALFGISCALTAVVLMILLATSKF